MFLIHWLLLGFGPPRRSKSDSVKRHQIVSYLQNQAFTPSPLWFAHSLASLPSNSPIRHFSSQYFYPHVQLQINLDHYLAICVTTIYDKKSSLTIAMLCFKQWFILPFPQKTSAYGSSPPCWILTFNCLCQEHIQFYTNKPDLLWLLAGHCSSASPWQELTQFIWIYAHAICVAKDSCASA